MVYAKNDGPFSTFQPMTDHSKPLTVHVVSNNSDGGINKNYSPYGTLLPLKDHYDNINLYTHLTIHVVSNSPDFGLA